MFRLKRRYRPEARVPDAAMADVAFLLIVFFLVSKSFYADKTPVTLPQSDDLTRVELQTKGAVNIALTQDGLVRVDGLPVAVEDLQGIAEAALARTAGRLFIVRADRSLPYRQVDRVVELLRRGRVQNIALETRSLREGGPEL